MNIRTIIKNSILWFGSLLHRNHASKILFYHDICGATSYKSLDSDVLMGTPLELFKKHLEVIAEEGYKIVPRITQPENEVAIMLDDGFRGIWDNREFFYEQGICPTVFLAVELIGKEGFLTESEILELQSHGFIFECHSWSHTNLAMKTDAELQRELGEARSYLSQLLGKDVRELCLPIGYFSDHLIELARAYGYTEIYSSIPGNYFSPVACGLRARNLCQFAAPQEVKYILRGGPELIRMRYEQMHHLPNFPGEAYKPII